MCEYLKQISEQQCKQACLVKQGKFKPIVKLKSFSDSGHGWLAVKRKDIPLEILNQISRFSYQRGDSVYLEEDCDASLFVNYLINNKIPYVNRTMKFVNRSQIRSYESYRTTITDSVEVHYVTI